VRAPGTSSCIRLMQRSTVLLPQPDGPMMAVTFRSGACMVIAATTWRLPYQASRFSMDRPSTLVVPASGVATNALTSGPLGAHAAPEEARGDGEDQDDRDQGQRSGPATGLALLEPAHRVVED